VASDPWISFGPDGTAYASGLILNPFGNLLDQGVATATSTDGGSTWRNVRIVARDGPAVSSDKDSITADPAHPGVAYVVWDRAASHGNRTVQPLWFSRTTDYGKSWSAPREIPEAEGQTIGHEVVVDPRTGTLYDFFSSVDEHAHVFCDPETEDCSNLPQPTVASVIVSHNGGDSWSSAHRISKFTAVGPGRMGGARIRTGARLVDAAIDGRTGALYVVWEDSRFTRGHFDSVVLSMSRDHGAHWSSPRAVPSPPGVPAVTPALAVDTRGRLGVTYYTLRSARRGTDVESWYWFVSGTLKTLRFGKPVLLYGPFNLLSAPYANGFFVGDYEGLATAGQSFVSMFAVANTGDFANRTDVIAAVLPDR